MKKRLSGIMLDILIILLSISMLNLVFMHATRSISDASDKQPIFDDLWIIQGDSNSSFTTFDSSMCLPDIIAYKQSGQVPYAIMGNSELLKTVYSVLSNLITDIFGKESIAIKLDENTASAYNTVVNSDAFIFFSYPSELPYHCIYAFSSGNNAVTYDMCSKTDPFYISDIAFLLEESSNGVTYKCIAFDRNGNSYEFKNENGNDYVLPASDIAHIDAYSESFKQVKFAASSPTFLDKSSYHPIDILYGSIEFSKLSPIFNISDFELKNQSVKKQLLDIFDINPEKINTYTDPNGTTVFIGTDDRLEISFDGRLIFTNANSPIEIKEIIGFSPSKINTYTVFDMLKASNVIINELTDLYPNYFGGAANTKLTAVYKNSDGNSVYEYSYYIGGVRIGTTPAFRFVFTSNGLAELTADASSYEQTTEKSATLPKETVYERLNLSNQLSTTTLITPIFTKSGATLTINWFSSTININKILS